MGRWFTVSLILASFLAQLVVDATELSHKEYQTFTNRGFKLERKELRARQRGNPYINLVKGIFNSKKGNLIQNVASVPCDTIQTLESDADAADQFVSQIQEGQVPSIIENLPEEAVSEFADIIGIATMITDVAEAAVTDVIGIIDDIEDGSIVSEFESIPLEIEDAITNGWNDFTNQVQSVWGDVTCFFEGGCSSSSAGFCSIPSYISAAATTDSAAALSAAAAGASLTSAFYASESSEAAAYTSAYYAYFYASESSAAAAGASLTSAFYASESSRAAAYTSAYYASYYASESSEAAAYTSAYYASFYASESSASEAAAYTSVFYASYDASQYSASAVSQNADSFTPAITSTPVLNTPTTLQTQTQGTAQDGNQNHNQGTQQSGTQPAQPSPSTQSSSEGAISYEWEGSHGLVVAALAVFGLALWL